MHRERPEAEVVYISCPTAYITHDYCNADDTSSPSLTLRGTLVTAKLTRNVRSYFPTSLIFKAENTADSLCWGVEFSAEHCAMRDMYSNVKLLPDYLYHESGRYRFKPDTEVFLLPFLIRCRRSSQTALLRQ